MSFGKVYGEVEVGGGVVYGVVGGVVFYFGGFLNFVEVAVKFCDFVQLGEAAFFFQEGFRDQERQGPAVLVYGGSAAAGFQVLLGHGGSVFSSFSVSSV